VKRTARGRGIRTGGALPALGLSATVSVIRCGLGGRLQAGEGCRDGQFSRLREAVSRVDGKRLDAAWFEPVRAHNGWPGKVADQVVAAVRHTKG